MKPIIEKQAVMVIGSRFLEGGTGNTESIFRALGIHYFSFLLLMLTRQYFSDTTSGFRATNLQATNYLAENQPIDYPEIESILLLHRLGLKICEVPVRMFPRQTGKSSIHSFQSTYYAIKVSLALLIEMLRSTPKVN
jgi:hypothetical protein